MIKLLICDDQDVVREGLKAILGTDAGLQVVGSAANGAEALDLIPSLKPDLVLMDLKMPIMNGVQATRQIHQQFPGIKVLVLTTYEADEWVFDAIRSGASGYLLKDTRREGLVAAIKDTVAGRTPVDSAVAGKLFAQVVQGTPRPRSALAQALSEREIEILQGLAAGLSNAEIAARLHFSEGTVRNYVSSILDKLGVADRTQAAILALRYGLADFGQE
ncbi:MAG TPA: response regulator transcription factor [Anaerolineales bacterium]|nr:response regulator transcription factor [Anaerolineales bacterium]